MLILLQIVHNLVPTTRNALIHVHKVHNLVPTTQNMLIYVHKVHKLVPTTINTFSKQKCATHNLCTVRQYTTHNLLMSLLMSLHRV